MVASNILIILSPIPGEMIQFDEHIFFNHKLVVLTKNISTLHGANYWYSKTTFQTAYEVNADIAAAAIARALEAEEFAPWRSF